MSCSKVAVLASFFFHILSWYESKNTNAIKCRLYHAAAGKGQIFSATTTALHSIKTEARGFKHQVNDVAVQYQKIKWRSKDLSFSLSAFLLMTRWMSTTHLDVDKKGVR